jgi:DNA-binding MarR family transcriptional regulator
MLTDIKVTVAGLMHDIARCVRYDFDTRTKAIGITRPQWRTLLTLSRMDGPSQSEVAEILEVERITLCRMVDRLADAGLVERRADPADRRVWRLFLTEKARPLVDQLSLIAMELEQDVLSVLSVHERETLTDLLTRVRNGIRARSEDQDANTSETKAVA